MDNITLIIVSLLFFYASNTSFTFGLGYFSLYRPLVLGFILGVITGDFQQCVSMGILINIMFYDFASTGGSIRFDMSIITVVSIMVLHICDLSLLQSLAVAFPFGLVGTAIFKFRLKYNGNFTKTLKKKIIEKPDKLYSFVAKPQIVLFFVSVISIIIINYILLAFNYFIKYDFIYKTQVMKYLHICGLSLLANYFVYFLIKEIKIRNLISLISIPMICYVPKISICILFLAIIIAMIFDVWKLLSYSKDSKNIDKYIGNLVLMRIWARWMNLSHASFNTENMQALALNSAMKPLYKKIYKSNREISKRLIDNFGLFNVEPNIGTVAIGYQLNMEETVLEGDFDNKKSESTKKSMMGLISGLGDSFTQTALLPVFLGVAIISMQLSYQIISILIMFLLLSSILMYSWMGLKIGYMFDKKGVMKYIEVIKNSFFLKFNTYIIYACFFMMYTLATKNAIYVNIISLSDVFLIAPVVMVSIVYNIIKKKNYDSIVNVFLLYSITALSVILMAII